MKHFLGDARQTPDFQFLIQNPASEGQSANWSQMPRRQVFESRLGLLTIRNLISMRPDSSLFDEQGGSEHTQSSALWKRPFLASFRYRDNHAKMIGLSNRVQGKPTDFQIALGTKFATARSPLGQSRHRRLTQYSPCHQPRTTGFCSGRHVFEGFSSGLL